MSHPFIADRVRRIQPSPSTSASERAAELQRQGRSIVNLAVGEPDFDTPLHIREAAVQAMAAGATRYTAMAGTLALRQAIAAKLRRENALDYSPQEMVVTSGAKSAIFNALAATLEAGDEVIVPAPYWVSYPDMVLACDGTPVIVACPEADGFKLTPDRLEAAITPRTRWLIINSPANPTGAIYDADEYRAIAQVLGRHPQVMVLTDDIYEHIRFDDGGFTHLLNAAPELRERVLLVNGVSKSYAMTGWRIGYAAGPALLIAAMLKLLSQSTGNCCAISQAAATAAMDGDQSFIAASVAVYRQRRDLAVRWLQAIPGLGCPASPGAFYLYVNCGPLIGRTTPAGERLRDDADVTRYLLEHAGVAAVAGAAYGLSPYFRLSIATAADVIEEGCRRIRAAVMALGPG